MDNISSFYRNTFSSSSNSNIFAGPISGLRASGLWIILVLFAYLVLIRSLRYRRVRKTEAQWAKRPWERMTADEASDIVLQLQELEFPATYLKALQFALFRSYGIPSISKLLAQTAQLSKAEHAGKRYADTSALFVEIWGNKPSDQRALEAFGRLNYIHGHYRDSNRISNDDMLYTLALFAIEPVKFLGKYEWRTTTELERCAIGVLNKSIGDAMLIRFDPLPSAKTGFRNGSEFLHELGEFAEAYEAKHMVPDHNNHETARETINLLLWSVPKPLRPFTINLVCAVMDERLRRAMKYEAPPPIYAKLVAAMTGTRKYVLRYLAPPRPRFMRSRLLAEAVDAEGRRNFTRYDNQPFYVRPTLMNRWGPGAWLSRLMGLPLPGDEGFAKEGFKTLELGPKIFQGRGGSAADETIARLRKEGLGACPFVRRS